MTALTLADFILARIDADEAEWSPEVNDLVMGGIAARVLAECEAKRRIVTLFPDAGQDGDGWNEAGAQVLAALALPYADHPDYDESWRP